MVSLMQRRRGMMESAAGEVWDYEWHASSGISPPGMTADSYDFTTEAGAMEVKDGRLDFNHVGNAEIVCEMKWAGGIPNNPQIVIKRANKAGAKVYGNVNGNSQGNITTNISGSNSSTGYSDRDYHTIGLKYDGSVFTLTIDGNETTGAGVTNNNYIPLTGISDSNGIAFYRSIKYRALA